MKSFFSISTLALGLAAGVAGAETIRVDVPRSIEPAQSSLTRAEVAADFQLWRLAGLEELSRGEQGPDTNSLAYRKAYATYVFLRQSPQYAALVSALQANPRANVVASRKTSPEAQASK